ncbi:MAG: SEC-C domain-containing protein [Elusimicrobia bacterium]|nr:SEC-C domain-containing protein [Elusimicrobiota bacterium]
MSWNPFAKIKEKLTGAPKSDDAQKAAEAALLGGGTPDLKELEKSGMMGKFFRYWKNPAFLAQMKAVAVAMQKDGVNVKDQAAVKAWVDKHQKDIIAGKFNASAASAEQKPGTFVKTDPEVGRNDACPCKSGKKYKKCCGAA